MKLLQLGSCLAAFAIGTFGLSSGAALADLRVGLVLDRGGKDDKSFNAAAFAGVTQAEKQLKMKIKVVEATDDNAFEPQMRALARAKYDLIIGVGFSQIDAVKKVSTQFPDRKFAIVDGEVANPNVRSLLFEEHEASFLVGALAAMKSTTGKLGFIGGMDIPLIRRFLLGYEAGAKHINPKVQVQTHFIGVTGEAWNNPPKAKELAISQYAKGNDIVFSASGASNSGVFDAAEEKKKLAIGVDSNQNWMKPGFILTSMLKRVDVAVFKTCEDVVNKKFTGGVVRFGLDNKGVDYALDEHNKKLITQDMLSRVETIKKDIIAGKIKVPDHYKMGQKKVSNAAPHSRIAFRSVAKSFGHAVANRDVSFDVPAKTIHGIVGENGAGKSTAMKMLYGMISPDSGEIFIDGKICRFRSPRDAVERRIGMVHQHFMLADSQTVLDNIILGAEFLSEDIQTTQVSWIRQFLPIPRAEARAKLQKIMTSAGIHVSLDARIETLPVGMQQRVEILKLLYRQANILILDEPTAVLTPQETTEFFAMLRTLRDSGCTILLISHKLGEIKAVTDHVTVFRRGQTIETRITAQTTETELAALMVGRVFQLEKTYERAPPQASDVLLVRDFSNRTDDAAHMWHLHQLSLRIAAGEIVGIAGVEGNGQDALIALLNSPREFLKKFPAEAEAQLMFAGQTFATESCVGMRERGLAVVAPDRHKQAVLLDESLTVNLFLGASSRGRSAELFYGPVLSQHQAMRKAQDLVTTYGVVPNDVSAPMKSLSGGNQQKFVCARELSTDPRLLIAAHPTRGVDIGAIEFIHQKLIEARNQGVGILLISSELDELMTLSDRIYVFFKGQVSGHFSASHFSKPTIGEAMGGRFTHQATI